LAGGSEKTSRQEEKKLEDGKEYRFSSGDRLSRMNVSFREGIKGGGNLEEAKLGGNPGNRLP